MTPNEYNISSLKLKVYILLSLIGRQYLPHPIHELYCTALQLPRVLEVYFATAEYKENLDVTLDLDPLHNHPLWVHGLLLPLPPPLERLVAPSSCQRSR